MKRVNLIKMATVFTCVAMFSGCTKAPEETKTKETKIPVVETTARETSEEVIIVATEETLETNEETEVILSLSEIDHNWRNFIRNYEDNGYYYGFVDDRNLAINMNGTIALYEMNSDGDIVQIESDADTNYYSSICRLNQDSLLRCPILRDLWNGEILSFDDNCTDGEYYGCILGVSDDGSTIFAMIGNPVRITDDLLDSQDQNSTYLEYNGLEIDVSEFGTVGDISHPDDVYYYLEEGEGNYVTINNRLVIIPVAEDIEITDNVATFMEYVNPEDYGQTAMTQTDFWVYISQYEASVSHVNGWYSVVARLVPIVIENGKVTRADIVVS